MSGTESLFEDGDVCMVFNDDGNAFHAFDYTPDALEAEAMRLRKAAGEVSVVTVGPSPFVTGTSSERRAV